MGALEGKVALVTGAARGQGRAHAITLAREGANVIAFDIAAGVTTTEYPIATREELATTVEAVENLGHRAIAVEGDVRSQTELDEAVRIGISEFGTIDILIANAGIWTPAPLLELTDEAWTETIDINLSGVYRSARAVVPHMIERKSGSIVMTASVLGLEGGMNAPHYTAAKHGVIGLMRAFARELAPHSVRCNAVCPGAVDTPMTNWQGAYDIFAGHKGGTREDFLHGAANFHALEGAGAITAQDVADAVLWLVSGDAAKVTGVALPVDGGHLLRS
ncbi:MAG TPA: mycofactocin-coupled SDR family oxidoreductase [Baekduia sp.]|nr:mycofactocin-coupled SDR family oxidoreductase [Baekduia sp.]